MLIVFTGNGKGKTTAAIGQAVRALGQNRKVFMVQFIKSLGYPSGEDATIPKLGENMHFEKSGLGFVGILGDALPIEEHKKAAHKAILSVAKALQERKYDLYILDEINVALHLNLLSLAEVYAFLALAGDDVDIIFTGRNAHPSILERADLVTEFQEVKHPYQLRVHARRGMEF